MDLFLLTLNKKKFFESKLIPHFYNVKGNSKIFTIKYKSDLNLNHEILKSYHEKPDIIIIDFNESSNSNIICIKNRPMYPIIYNGVLYITPICIEQINGFSNSINNKEKLFKNVVERILYSMGGILTEKQYSMINIDLFKTKTKTKTNNKTNNENIFTDGIKDIFTDFRRESIVNRIPDWMLTGIDRNLTGWFTIENSMAIDYIMKLYRDEINNIAELGSYFGKSTRYLASKKRDECKLFAFDDFKNVLLTDYIIENPNPLDYKYFLNRFKFEGFHKNLAEFNNIYSVKYDCFKATKWLKQNNILIDLFYIDFCKNDNKLIRIIDEIFELYPNAIVIGDDAQWLNSSLEYFSNKYNYIYCKNCYICSANRPFENKEKFISKLKESWDSEGYYQIEDAVKLNLQYRIKFIIKYIEKYIEKSINQKNKNSVIQLFNKLSVDPNERCRYIVQGGNLFHWIAMKYRNSDNKDQWLSLYSEINKKYADRSESNFLGLTPNDYFNYNLTDFL
jgi:hypothetical protein